MDQETSLKKGARGYWEIRWSEKTGDGWRSRAVSTRTKDRSLAEKVRREFVKAETQHATAQNPTLKPVFDAYELALRGRGASAAQFNVLRHIRAGFEDYSLDDITPAAVREYQEDRGVASSTLRRELGGLVAALNYGVKHHLILRAPAIELPPEGEPRPVWLDEEREAALWGIASQDIGPDGRLSRIGRFICIALETGARRDAIIGLTWDRVKLKDGFLDFRDPELRATKKRRVETPITDRLRPVLERAWDEKRLRDKHVLDCSSSIKSVWCRFVASHGFDDVTPHVLRHTRITLLLRQGVSTWDVGTLVGASEKVIRDVYGHPRADERLKQIANARKAA